MVTADGVTNPVEELTVLHQRINHANSRYHPVASIGPSWR
jgi:hypothetical protein